jgi:hypothetical protein
MIRVMALDGPSRESSEGFLSLKWKVDMTRNGNTEKHNRILNNQWRFFLNENL